MAPTRAGHYVRRQWLAFGQQVEDATIGVFGFQVVDAHLAIDRLGNVGGRDRLIGRIFGSAIAAAIRLAAANSAAGHHDTLAMRPMVAAAPFDAAATPVADLGGSAHLARDQQQRLIQQAALAQVFNQGRKAAVESRQQMIAKTVEIVGVRVPAASICTCRQSSDLPSKRP